MDSVNTLPRSFRFLHVVLMTVFFWWTGLYVAPEPLQARDTVGKRIFYKIDLKRDIDKAAFRLVHTGLEEARKMNADYCILDINTYGGALDAADSIRSAILRSRIPVIAFIDPQAASAGALISIACDSIYMTSGSSIGAATVVNQNGEVLPDKYQSFMRAMMRSTAESHGKKRLVSGKDTLWKWHRDPGIAAAMVSKDSVLSFTPLEAMENGYCEGMAQNTEEVIARVLGQGGEAYLLEEHKITALDKIIYFFLNPVVQGLLLMLIIGGIYFELQSPGIGFPTIAAVMGAVLYFAPLYLEGLAQNWEIVVFIIGTGLLLVEIFVLPGFGVAGAGGIILIVTGLTFAMIDNELVINGGDYDLRPLIKPLAIVLVSLTLSLYLSVYLALRLYPTRMFSRIALRTKLTEKEGFVGVETSSLAFAVGKTVYAATDLHPVGMVEIEGKRYQAKMNYGFAVKGETVKITRAEGGLLYCDKVN